ncbi:hypothetical protein T4A_11476 [Trichinella pseudospiralis]|uniref:Uncharacterized protein n=1 Tax=Trichinella pseudospiralis TaxID=6337 RepID=A0A0V1EQJ3_TRIPS|nr:hypothetical protein T4A_11476 [Trichinella pseudospiralis]
MKIEWFSVVVGQTYKLLYQSRLYSSIKLPSLQSMIHWTLWKKDAFANAKKMNNGQGKGNGRDVLLTESMF